MKTTAFLAFLSFVSICDTSIVRGQILDWTRQLGTNSSDLSTGVSADGLGNVYISGITYGILDGSLDGDRDAFVSKFDAAGNHLWIRQLGTSTIDEGLGISTDGLGNVYISGVTWGSLGGPNAGFGDVFVSKFDGSGNLLWNQQFGTELYEESYGVSADGLGNVYVSGHTTGSLNGPNAGFSDAFVTKYDADGNLLWTRQLGTVSDDYSKSVSADGLGNVYISGYTQGNMGGTDADGSDAFVSKYNDTGDLLWTRQLGTDDQDISYGVSADGLGNVYISGLTDGDLGGPNMGGSDAFGRSDAFVSKYNDIGTLLWTRQLGTVENDQSWGVSADGLGNVYMSGYTDGNLDGPNAGTHDAFVSKFDAAGNLLCIAQLGTSIDDLSFGVSADGMGNAYISGQTEGSLGGETLGGLDAFVAKFNNVPEPGTLLLAAIGCMAVVLRMRR